MKVSVSVPGKIHLMGEHAVVYGKPALLAAINLRLSVTVEPSTHFEIVSGEPDTYIRYIVGFVADTYKLSGFPKVKCTVVSAIPSGYHLGSSAAVAVGVVGALSYYLKKVWNPQFINQLAYEVEKHQHGNPSGGDNTSVTMGGFLWYRKELEFLKSIWQLPFRPAGTLNHFFLVNTGRPKETTREMVEYVRNRVRGTGDRMKKLFDENEEQTKKVTVALKEGDEKTLIESIQKGERTLEKMGVVSTKVTPLIRKIERLGGAAKILGGGGKQDGVGFLLCYGDKKKIKKVVATYGYATQDISLGEEGVRLEQKS